MFESESARYEISMIFVKLLVGVQLFGDEDLEEVVDELALEGLDRLELEEVIEEEGVRVGQRGHDATLSLFASLTRVLRRVRAQKLDHDLKVKQRKFKLKGI